MLLVDFFTAKSLSRVAVESAVQVRGRSTRLKARKIKLRRLSERLSPEPLVRRSKDYGGTARTIYARFAGPRTGCRNCRPTPLGRRPSHWWGASSAGAVGGAIDVNSWLSPKMPAKSPHDCHARTSKVGKLFPYCLHIRRPHRRRLARNRVENSWGLPSNVQGCALPSEGARRQAANSATLSVEITTAPPGRSTLDLPSNRA